MSTSKAQEKLLRDCGLSVYNNQWSDSYCIEFNNLTDEESICYIMCSLCGWSNQRLAKFLKVSRETVRRRLNAARRKRKIS